MKQKLIHISDLHIHAYPQHYSDYFSNGFPNKRILGTLNLFLRRAKKYPLTRTLELVHYLEGLEWDQLIISGDLTQLGLEREFELARKVLDPLLQDSSKVSIIPGNHDRYIKEKGGVDYFQQYFGEFFSETEVLVKALKDDWHLLGWDSANANDWWSATGTVRQKTICASEDYIQQQHESARFIIANHFPLFFPPNTPVRTRHDLLNLEQVRHWIWSNPKVRMYLHGHEHENVCYEVMRNHAPLTLLNSAASSSFPAPAKQSSFHKITLEDGQTSVEGVRY